MEELSFIEELRRSFSGPIETSSDIRDEDLSDESLHRRLIRPLALVRPRSTSEVQSIVRWATEHEVPITPRGSGTGLSGAVTPCEGGVIVAFDQMNHILDIDQRNHTAVVEAGVTLEQLEEALANTKLRYSVYPGETSSSIGGNVNTNAGGMRAVRYGVTRHHVLGLEIVLVDGQVLHTGGRVVKSSSGYDLTQLIVGSEGTLGLVTQATLKLSPRVEHSRALLIPFVDTVALGDVVSEIIGSGIEPTILEYLDNLTLTSITRAGHIALGVPPDVESHAGAYLLTVLECRTGEQLDSDSAAVAELVERAGALDTFALSVQQASELVAARERVFWIAKAAGANDIVDVVVPRADVTSFLDFAAKAADEFGVFIAGCGHVGDGNVHLSVYQPDDASREDFLRSLFREGLHRGGAISGEHGIGLDKLESYLELTDPAILEIQRAIKAVFDPHHILNPGRHPSPRQESR